MRKIIFTLFVVAVVVLLTTSCGREVDDYQQNRKAGEEFLQKNARRSGVVTLPSGVQYEVLKEGEGAIPTVNSEVQCHYFGMLIDGQVFDSSIARGRPSTFSVVGLIKGWQEVLQLMPVGSKWRVFIPQELAYGQRGAGHMIAPYSALIFEIELLSIIR